MFAKLKKHKVILYVVAALIVNDLILVGAWWLRYHYFSSSHDIISVAGEPIVTLGNARTTSRAGNYGGRGSIILRDRSHASHFDAKAPKKLSNLEIGFYNYGAGIFSDDHLEFWLGDSFSIANHNRTPDMQLRNYGDTKSGFWANGAGEIGTQMNDLKIHIGSWSGQRNNYKGKPADNVPDFQYRFRQDGVLEVEKDILINGVSLKEALSDL